jgi:hypothetical protein
MSRDSDGSWEESSAPDSWGESSETVLLPEGCRLQGPAVVPPAAVGFDLDAVAVGGALQGTAGARGCCWAAQGQAAGRR